MRLLKFEKIRPTPRQINLLFYLLKERKHFISHNSMPSQDEHYEFVVRHPYLAWYLVQKRCQLIGSFYLQPDNSVGLNLNEFTKTDVAEIIHFIKEHHTPLPLIRSVRREEFFVNVPPCNVQLINILEQLSKDELQRSFLL